MKGNKSDGESRFWQFFNQQHSGESILNMIMQFFQSVKPMNNMIQDGPNDNQNIGINVSILETENHQMYVVVDRNMPVTELCDYIAKMYESNFVMENELDITDYSTKRKQPRYKCIWIKKYNAGRIQKQYLVMDVIHHEEWIEAKMTFDDREKKSVSSHGEAQNTLPLETPSFNFPMLSAELAKKGQMELEPQDLNKEVKGSEDSYKEPRINKNYENSSKADSDDINKQNIRIANEIKKNKKTTKEKKTKDSKKSKKDEKPKSELIKFPTLLEQMSDDVSKKFSQKQELDNFFGNISKTDNKVYDKKHKVITNSDVIKDKAENQLSNEFELLNKKLLKEVDSISAELGKPVKRLKTQSEAESLGKNKKKESPIEKTYILRKISSNIETSNTFKTPVTEPQNTDPKNDAKKEDQDTKITLKNDKKSKKKSSKREKDKKTKKKVKTDEENQKETLDTTIPETKNDSKLTDPSIKNNERKQDDKIVQEKETKKHAEFHENTKMLEENCIDNKIQSKEHKVSNEISELNNKKTKKKNKKSDKKSDLKEKSKITLQAKCTPEKNITPKLSKDRRESLQYNGTLHKDFEKSLGHEMDTPFKTAINHSFESEDFKENSSDSFKPKIDIINNSQNIKLIPHKKSSQDFGDPQLELGKVLDRKISIDIAKAVSVRIEANQYDVDELHKKSSDVTFGHKQSKQSSENVLNANPQKERYDFDEKMATYLEVEKSSDSNDSPEDTIGSKRNNKPDYMKNKLPIAKEKHKKNLEKNLTKQKFPEIVIPKKNTQKKTKPVSSSDSDSSSSEDEKEIRKTLITTKKNLIQQVNKKNELLNKNLNSKKNSSKKPEIDSDSESSKNDNKKGKKPKKNIQGNLKQNDMETSNSDEDPEKLSLIKNNIKKGLFFDDSDSSSDDSVSEEKNPKKIEQKKVIQKATKVVKDESDSDSSIDSDKKLPIKVKSKKDKYKKAKVLKKVSDSSSDDSDKNVQAKKKKTNNKIVDDDSDSEDSSSNDKESSNDDGDVSQTSNIVHKKFNRHSNIFKRHNEKVANFCH